MKIIKRTLCVIGCALSTVLVAISTYRLTTPDGTGEDWHDLFWGLLLGLFFVSSLLEDR